eukprot:12510069-Ditylum_brightwellii.AAC.1
MSGHGVRFADEQWAAEQGNIVIPTAEANYYAIMQQPCDEEEHNMSKIGCIGTGIGVALLTPMNYK